MVRNGLKTKNMVKKNTQTETRISNYLSIWQSYYFKLNTLKNGVRYMMVTLPRW